MTKGHMPQRAWLMVERAPGEGLAQHRIPDGEDACPLTAGRGVEQLMRATIECHHDRLGEYHGIIIEIIATNVLKAETKLGCMVHGGSPALEKKGASDDMPLIIPDVQENANTPHFYAL
ncbi:hypothetical protein BH688_11450 [Kushneria phosphatilytica]|nr:hypothetical protein BH688_11450 [Kushneria phosphatilytica]